MGKDKKRKSREAEVEESEGADNTSAVDEKKAPIKKQKKAKKASKQVDADEARKSLKITVDGDNETEFCPILDFEGISWQGSEDDPNLTRKVLECCQAFDKPTPVQSQAWPVLFAGRDLIAIASTGSGKTLGFCVPGLVHLTRSQKRDKISMLVLAPTRELATQIFEVSKAAADNCGYGAVCLYGGVEKGEQRRALRSARIVIATPGRLLDLVEEGHCDLSNVTYFVLDEADRMLDMGFERDVRRILALVPTKRQTCMFSATWPQEVQALASEFLTQPIRFVVGAMQLSAAHTVTQRVEVVEPREKEQRLAALISQYHSSKQNRVLVFCLYKKEAARIEEFLRRKGWNVAAIHGDMTQVDRNKAFNAFRAGTVPLLVATDVAARGLDIPDVEYVINVTFPLTIEDYVHRIGRTGRAGKSGVAHTFFTAEDKTHSGALVNVLREAGQQVPESLLKFGTGVKRKEHKMYGAFFKGNDDGSAPKQSTKITFDESDDD
eukprot:c8525_g1_i1.p1 GENE.c8525_g1_i1~~c8525_g1_i1.p1  ORF type:complete len:494 (-),score=104.38 c8525_g1_i1:484-1965(-)